MPDVVMPRLSDSMEEGTLLRWLRADGEEVRRGDEIAEIETDKATMPFEADADGILHHVAGEGDTLPLGAVIATIGERREDAAEATDARGAARRQAPAAAPQATAAPARPTAPADGADGADGDGRPKASPLARRLARERGIDLAALEGTGPGGRIVKADVEAAATLEGDGERRAAPAQAAPAPEPAAEVAPAPGARAAGPAAEAPAPEAPAAPEVAAPVGTGTVKGEVRVEELTRTQQVVARRMAESKATIPEYTVRTEVDMERCVELRAQLERLGGSGDGTVPSFNDMVVKAVALALRESPRANGAYRDGRFELYSRVNVGVAVAAEDVLVVPTVFDADRKGLGQIARETRALAERVRAGAITPPEVSGGTFTVSNLGMYGVTEFTAIINGAQAAILAVGAMVARPVVRDGEVVVRTMMNLTLVCDHRILYGADAARFLARVRARLEEPLALAL